MDTINSEPTMSLTEWSEGYTTNMIKLVIMTIVFIVTIVLLFTVGNIQEIAKNFPRYRCNPLIMPFAANFGYDTQENFNYCLTSIFNVKAAEIFTPIYGILGQFTNVLTLVMNVALGIRKLFSNFLLGINNFIRNVRDRIQGLLFNVRMSFLKMNNLMGRVYGTMYAVIWMGTSAMTAGLNVGDNDLVRFLMEFCFAPNTPIEMADGSFRPISALKIGDTLATVGNENPRVTSVFRFAGDKTPMVQIADVVLSAAHYIQSPTGWTIAEKHPDALTVASIPELVCLNVSGHTFRAGLSGQIVADYDEHESDDVVRKTQIYAMKHLNGFAGTNGAAEDYSLGLHGDTEVSMANGKWKKLSEVKIGDIVWNSGRVLGVVQEECEEVVEIHGTKVSSAQTVFDGKQMQWIRAFSASAAKVIEVPDVFYNLITERCSTMKVRGTAEFFVRDYREIADPDMEAEYAEEFVSNNVKKETTGRGCPITA